MPGAELRVFLRDQNADLRDTFLNNGYQSIPVVVFFDKDWNEIGRWLDTDRATRREGNPYADWIAMYAGADYQKVAAGAIANLDALMARDTRGAAKAGSGSMPARRTTGITSSRMRPLGRARTSFSFARIGSSGAFPAARLDKWRHS